MKVAIRTDASLEIGTGHVMRCLTLANELKKRGADIFFICRALPGHLAEFIESHSFKVYLLPTSNTLKKNNSTEDTKTSYQNWLGVSWQQDAEETHQALMKQDNVSWLIVDHYAIDERWEKQQKNVVSKIMVVDDLANRIHNCDMLLDQTYGRQQKDYQDLVTHSCQFRLGAQYALLRPEFYKWREYSLNRRKTPKLKKILITMGGVDSDNITGQILEHINNCELHKDLVITVVMGITAPNLDSVKKMSEIMPYKTEVKVNVNNMAELMSNADLSIGAVGATTWERCCLGLPTIMIALAENQLFASKKLEQANIGWVLNSPNQVSKVLCELESSPKTILSKMTKSSIAVTDGKGVKRICNILESFEGMA